MGVPEMLIASNSTLCSSCGKCMETAPTVFDWDENSLVLVLKETPEAGEEDAVREAVANCPSGAIWLVSSE